MDNSAVETGVPEAWLTALANLVSVRSPLAGALYQRLVNRPEWTPAQRAAFVKLAPWVGPNAAPAPTPEVASGDIAFGVMGYHTPDPIQTSRNIGDWVQTLSMMSHVLRRPAIELAGDEDLVRVLGEVQDNVPDENKLAGPAGRLHLVEVNRDATLYDSLPEHTWTFVFGWYMKQVYGGRDQFPLNDRIIPLFISFHISHARFLTPAAVEYLKANAPVGCRDWHTVRLLHDKGIPAYFSGCMTTTVGGLFPAVEIDPSKPVAYVDANAPEGATGIVRLKNLDDGLRTRPLAQSMTQAIDRMNRYRNDFSRIVTSRLHTALPAESCGLVIEWQPRDPKDRRFVGLIGENEPPRDKMRERISGIMRVLIDAILSGESPEAVRELYAREVADDLLVARERLEAEAK
ncbi:hypothetical protein [Microbacterium gorillae]|uniref:hypothetical protein n=1 Tax=Microbacterium gorillae TaxID=1231063 RepID=UPI003D96C2CC